MACRVYQHAAFLDTALLAAIRQRAAPSPVLRAPTGHCTASMIDDFRAMLAAALMGICEASGDAGDRRAAYAWTPPPFISGGGF